MTLQEIDEQILDSLHDEHNIGKEIDKSSEFALCISKHQNRMQLWIKPQTETPENINLSISNVAPQSPSSNSVISTRFPKLELKHFNGDPTKFQSF